MNANNDNEQEEKPVEFFHEKDLFGFDKPTVEPETEQKPAPVVKEVKKVEPFIPGAPYSEYQSIKHFVILNILSFGLYQLYWFYRHWRYLRDEKNLNIMPAMRTLFIIIFGYSFFRKFYQLAKEKGYTKKPPLALLFILYIVIQLPAVASTFLAMLSCLSFLFLIPVLNMMNFYYLKEQVNYNIKIRLSGGEKNFLIICWVILLFIALIKPSALKI